MSYTYHDWQQYFDEAKPDDLISIGVAWKHSSGHIQFKLNVCLKPNIQLTFVPVEKKSEKSPDFKLYVHKKDLLELPEDMKETIYEI